MINKFLLIFGVFTLFSCGKPEIFSQVKEFSDAKMLWNDPTEYQFTIEEEEPLNAFFHIQHNNDYAFRNIYFFTRVEWPNGEIKEDTLQYMLAKPSGEWLGSGIGASKKMYLHYPLNINHKGNYKVNVWQAMRKDTLVGIEKLAFSIQKHEN